ncbi:RNA polymerase sigma factor [Geothrix sp. PMB-07]|uniref:RNA polymerase sigma factor n=1 Tax=Geothrix sp. PMB-07 TaxID=3068640 RepID=UPI002740E882|nr:sigma-70 family RNA polymerase sigma factor [Geothrix sp. PMB-07]WLT31241.1 sigma-70 family RNA polymerase sigma factor [Geothrix sp. PMB-07]
MTLRSDKELVAAALEQDLGAFDELMQRYERLVYKVAFNFVHDSETAFDVSQTVFLKAFQRLAQFRHEAQVKTWLMRITHNESIDCLRHHRARGADLDPLEEASPHLAMEAAQERDLLQRDDRAQLSRALARLNERHRLAVILRYFQGLGIQEVALILGCSEGVTKNMLFRSVRTLREALSGSL